MIVGIDLCEGIEATTGRAASPCPQCPPYPLDDHDVERNGIPDADGC